MLEPRLVRHGRRPYLYFFMQKHGGFDALTANRDVIVYDIGTRIAAWMAGHKDPFPKLEPGDAERLSRPGGLLILDYSGDANPLGPLAFDTVAGWADARAIPLDRIVIVSQNPVAQRDRFDRWAHRARPAGKIRFGFAHAWLDWTIDAAEAIPTEAILAGIDARKSHRFLSLNNAPRPHRVLLVELMLQRAAAETLASLSVVKHANTPGIRGDEAFAEGREPAFIVACRKSPAFMARWGDLVEGFDIAGTAAKATLPPVRSPETTLFDEAEYFRSLLSVVGETEMSDGTYNRITEKTFKPALLGHPFLVAGNKHALRMVRRFGLRTFPELFDESYDVIEDPVERLAAVLGEIARLAGEPLPLLAERVAAVRDKLSFNVRRMKNDVRPAYHAWLARHLADLIEGGPGIKRTRDIGPFH